MEGKVVVRKFIEEVINAGQVAAGVVSLSKDKPEY